MRSSDVPSEQIRHHLDRIRVLKDFERRGTRREMVDRFEEHDQQSWLEGVAGVEDT